MHFGLTIESPVEYTNELCSLLVSLSLSLPSPLLLKLLKSEVLKLLNIYL